MHEGAHLVWRAGPGRGVLARGALIDGTMYHNRLSANHIEHNNEDIYIHRQTIFMYKIESSPMFGATLSYGNFPTCALIWLQEAG